MRPPCRLLTPCALLSFASLLAPVGGCAQSVDDFTAAGFFGDDGGGAAAVDAGPGSPPSTPSNDAGTTPSRDAATHDASTTDAAAADSAVALDAAVADSSAGDTSTTADAGVLDPALALPDPSGSPCTSIGSTADCAFGEVCRIDNATGGRCESCSHCHGFGHSCTTNAQCSAGQGLQCYTGVCTFICQLGSHDCGRVSDCLDVGNATFGVCRTQ